MVKVSEISKHMDLTEVQLYIINGAKVVFLRRRPQPKAPRGTSSNYTCTVCGRHLQVCALGGYERRGGCLAWELEESFVLSCASRGVCMMYRAMPGSSCDALVQHKCCF